MDMSQTHLDILFTVCLSIGLSRFTGSIFTGQTYTTHFHRSGVEILLSKSIALWHLIH